MRTLIFVTALAAYGLNPGGAWAKATTLATTRGEVTKQCGKNSSGCVSPCGSTMCTFDCKKKGCTVTVYLTRPPEGANGSPGGNATMETAPAKP